MNRLILIILIAQVLSADNLTLCNKSITYNSTSLSDDSVSIEINSHQSVSNLLNVNATVLRLGLESDTLKLNSSGLTEFLNCLLDNNLFFEANEVLIYGISQAQLEFDVLLKSLLKTKITDSLVSKINETNREDLIAIVNLVQSENKKINQDIISRYIYTIVESLFLNKQYYLVEEIIVANTYPENIKKEIYSFLALLESFKVKRIVSNISEYKGTVFAEILKDSFHELSIEVASQTKEWSVQEYKNFIINLDLEKITLDTHSLIFKEVNNNLLLILENLNNHAFYDKILYLINLNSEIKDKLKLELFNFIENNVNEDPESSIIYYEFLVKLGSEYRNNKQLDKSLYTALLDKNPELAKRFKHQNSFKYFYLFLLPLLGSIFFLVKKIKTKKKKIYIKEEIFEVPVFSQMASQITREKIELINRLSEFGLKSNSQISDVKNYYRKIVKDLHPDLNKDLTSKQLDEFTKITQNYDRILDLFKTINSK